jgi:hypothetical protein
LFHGNVTRETGDALFHGSVTRETGASRAPPVRPGATPGARPWWPRADRIPTPDVSNGTGTTFCWAVDQGGDP